MGQLGFMEMMVIFLVALLVFGPKKLPELGKSLGKGLREFKKATNDLKSNWEEQVREVEHSVDDVKHTIHQTNRDIRDLNVNEVNEEVKPEPPPVPYESEPASEVLPAPVVIEDETKEKEEVKPDAHPN